jgi:hypothetical protein
MSKPFKNHMEKSSILTRNVLFSNTNLLSYQDKNSLSHDDLDSNLITSQSQMFTQCTNINSNLFNSSLHNN